MCFYVSNESVDEFLHAPAQGFDSGTGWRGSSEIRDGFGDRTVLDGFVNEAGSDLVNIDVVGIS